MTFLKYKHYLIPLFLQVVITFFGILFMDLLGMINIALIHLIPILVIALEGDMKATMIVATISVILFDLLYVPPTYSFTVHDLLYVWSFILFYVAGYIITAQAMRLRITAVKDILLNTLSHDLKTPLASILGNTSILLKKQALLESDREEIVHQIKQSAQQMNRLISTLLDSARIQNSKTFLYYQWCDMQDIIGIALQEFDLDATKIQITIDPNIPLYWGDEALLTRLLVNLIDNALKYSSSQTMPISISITSLPSSICITVFNQSPSLSKDDLYNMFERFYRLDTTADIKGSGIGLAICKEIVHAHHGKIQAFNEESGISIKTIFPIEKSHDMVYQEQL
ncbi:MAG: ATP-binding protein [Sulfurimonas sp.]|nr:ATP-binding protein [Sulfurimonas sp.]MDD5202138.1 ATP-binding protein [Sulfurimonas sp.]